MSWMIIDQGSAQELTGRISVLEQDQGDPAQFHAARDLIVAELNELPPDAGPIRINASGGRVVKDGKIEQFSFSCQIMFRHM